MVIICFLQDIIPVGRGEHCINAGLVLLLPRKDHDEWDNIELYARRIQKLERELEIEITDFSEWGIE